MAPDALLDAVDELALVYNRTVIPDVMPLPEVERPIEHLTTNTERTVELERIEGTDEGIDADVRDLANQPGPKGNSSNSSGRACTRPSAPSRGLPTNRQH